MRIVRYVYSSRRILFKNRTELTFIICYREHEISEGGNKSPILTMIGDVNLFLKGLPNEEDFEAEVEIMIAGQWIETVLFRCLHMRRS